MFPSISAEPVVFKPFSSHLSLKESTVEACLHLQSQKSLVHLCPKHHWQISFPLELKQRQHLGYVCIRSLRPFFLPDEYNAFSRNLPIGKPQEEISSPSTLPLTSHTPTAHSFKVSCTTVLYFPIFRGWCKLLIYRTQGS